MEGAAWKICSGELRKTHHQPESVELSTVHERSAQSGLSARSVAAFTPQRQLSVNRGHQNWQVGPELGPRRHAARFEWQWPILLALPAEASINAPKLLGASSASRDLNQQAQPFGVS